MNVNVNKRTSKLLLTNPITGNAKARRKPGQEAAKFKTDEGSGKMIIVDSSDDESAPQKAKAKSQFQPQSKVRFGGSATEMDVDNNVDTTDAAGGGAGGNAYLEGMVSTDGFTRGPNGRVKFNKDTKKRRRIEIEMDVDGGGETGGRGGEGREGREGEREGKRRSLGGGGGEKKLGHEFKAKVRSSPARSTWNPLTFLQKAGGDVKKGNVDPYAYVPLGQAAKHQKGAGHGHGHGKGGKGKGRIGIASKR